MLRPVNSSRGNETLLYEVNNRGTIAILAHPGKSEPISWFGTLQVERLAARRKRPTTTVTRSRATPNCRRREAQGLIPKRRMVGKSKQLMAAV